MKQTWKNLEGFHCPFKLQPMWQELEGKGEGGWDLPVQSIREGGVVCTPLAFSSLLVPVMQNSIPGGWGTPYSGL